MTRKASVTSSKYEARKYMGDDECSWAIFRKGEIEPMVTGLRRSECAYYKKRCAESDAANDRNS